MFLIFLIFPILSLSLVFSQCTVDNCELCPEDKSICTKCLPYQALYEGDCFECSTFNCPKCTAIYNSEGFNINCNECDKNYYLSENECIPCENLKNCLICDTKSDNCLECNSGFYLDSDFQCVSCGKSEDLKCKECESLGGVVKCKSCNPDSYLNNGKCSICDSAISNCNLCESNTKCTDCKNGFYLDPIKFNCLACQVKNCSKCNPSSPNKCIECSAEYFLNSNSECIRCKTNCEKCSNTQDCENCLDGYFVSTNICKKCSDNCNECTDGSKCTICAKDYLLDSLDNCVKECSLEEVKIENKCVLCRTKFKNCQKCNSKTCTQCYQNLYNYTDAKTNDCTDCLISEDPLNTKVGNQCLKKPIPKILDIKIASFVPTISIQCAVSSKVYLIYGLYTIVNKTNLGTVKATLGQKKYLEATDRILYWTGYESFDTNENGDASIKIIRALKNSGETYHAKIWCISKYGGLGNDVHGYGSWIQTSNLAKIAQFKVNINQPADYILKNNLGLMFKNTIEIFNRFVSDEGDELKNFIIYDKKTVNLTNNYTTNYTVFYVMPIYNLKDNSDFFKTLKEFLSSKSNLKIVQEKINSYSQSLSSIPLNIIDVVDVLEINEKLSDYPIFSNIYPKLNFSDNAIEFQLKLNTNGKISYAYSSASLSTIKNQGRKLEENVIGNSNILFLEDMDMLRIEKIENYKIINVEKNELLNINISGLEKSENYFIFYQAQNEGVPIIKTDLFAQYGRTSKTILDNLSSMRNIIQKISYLIFFIICFD